MPLPVVLPMLRYFTLTEVPALWLTLASCVISRMPLAKPFMVVPWNSAPLALSV